MDTSLIGFQGLPELFNIHPIFVHFPIVLFPVSLFFYFLAWVTQKNGIGTSAQILLLLGLLSAIIATITGLLAKESFPHDEVIHHIMQTHEKIAYLILSAGGVLFAWSFFKKQNHPRFFPAFIMIFSGLCLTIFLSADLGGRMVFLHGASVKTAAPEPENHEHEHHHTHD